MQVVRTPGGDRVAVMEPGESLVAEVALSRYVALNPDSHIAVRLLAEFSHANEQAEALMEDAAEGAAPA
ncbi:hypothetical protein ACWDBP_34905 [Streptomyces sp. NPDC001233]|uniref:hypothetical protein n=1 Tax=Streptomyces sp. NPDC002589 TaxID=3154420 RepID=UPI0033268BF6